MLINILLENNRFFLIFMYWTSFFVKYISFYSIWQKIVFCCDFIHHFQNFAYFHTKKIEGFFRKTFEFKLFFPVTDNCRCINLNAFIIRFFSDYHVHVCFKYILSDPLIPSICFYHELKNWCIYLFSLCM